MNEQDFFEANLKKSNVAGAMLLFEY